MKKRIITFSLCFCILISVLSGCSCNDLDPLEFNKNFMNETTFGKETLTYSIDFNPSASANFKNVEFNYEKGEYKTVLEVLSTPPTLPDGLTSDIFGNVSKSAMFYKLSTTMTLPVYYKTAKDEISRTDTISTVCYMCDVSHSLAPIYSKTESDYTILDYSDDFSSVQNVKTSCEVLYDFSSYKMTSVVFDKDGKATDTQVKTYEYSFKTVIDNTQLLFAIRNTNLDEGKAKIFPTVSRNYGDSVELYIKNQTSKTNTFSVHLNEKGAENDYQPSVSYSEFQFYINTSASSGSAQKVCIQNSQKSELPFNSYIVSYEEPLIAYGVFTIMGSLVYNVTNVTIE